MIAINFDHAFPLASIASDLSYAIFDSLDVQDKIIPLKVEISPLADPYLPNVHNLAFGPLQQNGNINDNVKLHHRDTSRVFSIILLFALSFLQTNPTATIGLDGSNDVRAYLYHRMFLSNREYLSHFFIAIGVGWFVRLFRDGTIETDEDGYRFFKPKPEPFDYRRPTRDLYRYYMFYLR